jgi:MoaA/NifB/PqqE/SkfB family radical SAM enzyme
MTQTVGEVAFQRMGEAWLRTASGEPRGYIQPETLAELWFHTGTVCNLSCPFCLEGSKPGDNRLNRITLEDARPFIEEALELGVEQFSFTGGEPFVNRDMVAILDHALDHRPCMVLTNGTAPVQKRLGQIAPLREKPHGLRFRVSLDYPDPARHDVDRGEGNFASALETMGSLHRLGFHLSIARLAEADEDTDAVNALYLPYFEQVGLPADTHITVFPDFLSPGAHADTPEITENCMTTYHSAETRARFMCAFSKMVVKRDGRMRVYACTLVDDDRDYDLGDSLAEAMPARVMLRHHRCFSCFAHGASCSET